MGKHRHDLPKTRQRAVAEVKGPIRPIRPARKCHACFRDGRRHVQDMTRVRISGDHVNLAEHSVAVLFPIAIYRQRREQLLR